MTEFTSNDLWLIIASARWTLLLAAMAFTGGLIGGFAVALARTSSFSPLRWLTTGYIRFFQGTPLMILLLLCFFGPSLFISVNVSPWLSAAIALSLYASAGIGEILRGSIQAVPRGLLDAAKILGLSRRDTFIFITLPQTLRTAVPSLIGFLIQLIKATSLASVIGFAELSRTAQVINNQTFRPFLIFSIVAVIYFIFCWPLSKLGKKLDVKFNNNQ